MIYFLSAVATSIVPQESSEITQKMIDHSFEISELFKKIQPNLTLGGVCLALFFVAFKVGKYFWDKEETIRSESLSTLKEILGRFKDSTIRPVLERKTREWVFAAYDEAISLIEIKMKNDSGEFKNNEEIKNLFSRYEKNELLGELKSNDKIDEFYSSGDGVKLLDQLDRQYLNSRDYKRCYDTIIFCCKALAYLCFLMSFIFLSGILYVLLSVPVVIISFYLYTILLLLLLIIFFFVRFEIHKSRYARVVEHYNMTGDISA